VISHRDEEGFASYSVCPCYRAVAFTPLRWRCRIGQISAPHAAFALRKQAHLRIPFLLALPDHGLKVTAVGTGETTPFARAGVDYHRFRFDRFINPLADWSAITALRGLIENIRPDIAQSFDTKPNLLVPLATRGNNEVAIIRTMNGLGWIYSSRSLLALALCPVYRALHRLAARSTAMTVFQNQDDQSFFERHAMTGAGLSRLIPGSGIDIGRFEQAIAAGPAPADVRRTLGLENCEIVITVTRLTRQKGIPALLEARERRATSRDTGRDRSPCPLCCGHRLAIGCPLSPQSCRCVCVSN
jgi:hypothetical protein